MGFGHEEIKDKLPEYIKNGSFPDEIKNHLQICNECREEVSLLKAINNDHVPEPGNMFFDTLPQKIRTSIYGEKKSIFPRLVPVFVLIALIVVGGYIYFAINITEMDEASTFSNPFAPFIYDLSALNTDNIPSIDEIVDEDVISLEENSFLREFTYLNSEEINNLYLELGIRDTNGGVL